MFVRTIVVLAVLACAHGIQLTDRQALFKHLMDDYEEDRSKDVIPEQPKKPVDVKVGIHLLRLEADEDRKALTAYTWISAMWTDKRLSWDPEAFGGIKMIRVPSKYLWIPDIALFNGLDEFQLLGGEVNAVAYHDGSVLYIPQVKLHVPYERNAEGIASASFKLGSWTFDSLKLDPDFYGGEKAIDVTDYMPGGSKLTENQPAATKNTKYYPGIPEPYVDLTFNVNFI